ncbi:MAG: hypothetical protein ABSH22_08125 [Tepidisphaeraceae bacterium]|jgi:hypothetical protein
MQQNQKPNSSGQPDSGANWPGVFMEALAFSVAVFLRRRFGDRYVGVHGAIAAGLILFIAASCRDSDAPPMFIFLAAYLCMCARARAGVLRRRLQGLSTSHSRYNGWPRVMRFFPHWNEVSVKRFVEPGMAFVAAILAYVISVPLGLYLMVAAMSLFVTSQMIELRNRKLALDMHDAVIEAQERAERFRSFRGER